MAGRYAFSVGYPPSTFASAARLHLWRSPTTGWRLFASLAAVLAVNVLVFGPVDAVPVAALEVASDDRAGRLRGDAVKQIGKFSRVWLLMRDLTRFFTSPLAGAPAEALQILNEKVRSRPLSRRI